MSNVVIGCDSNNGNDSKFQSTVAKLLTKQGHKVEKLSIGPTPFGSIGYKSSVKGKIGVYIMAASLTSVADLSSSGWQFKYTYFVIRGDIEGGRIKSVNDFNSKAIHKDPEGDCRAAACDRWNGKTYPEINKEVKSKGMILFGGKTGEEIGNNLIKAMGGETSDSSDSNSDKSSSSSSAKECIQKLLKHWDGEVECRIRNGKVYINKIREPQSSYKLVLQEGVNVFSDSITVTDVNPKTINHLVVRWSGGTISFKDEELIKRFGEIKSEVEAVKKIVKKVNKSSSNTTNGSNASSATDTNSTTADADTSSGLTEDTVDIGEVDPDTGDDSSKTTVVEKPITKYQEALKFGNIEWNKIKRDNGHTIECQTRGSSRWVVGEWVKVIFPSFNEYGYMYISRSSQSDDAGDWTASLTLVDYPPGWGAEETDNNSNSGSSSGSANSSNVDDVINKIVNEINKFSYSHSCSDANCIKSSKKGDCWALSDYIAGRLKKEGIDAKIYQYKTSGSNQHRQVKYNNGSSWVMFPYSKSKIDHKFYTNTIPSGAKPL